MANTVNMGNQTLTWDYLNQASSLSFNKLLRDLLTPGIYRGGLLSYNSGTVSVAPFACLIETNNAAWDHQLAVRVETVASYGLTYNASTPYIIGELEWLEVENNYLELKCVNAAYLSSNPHVIIFGKVETDFSINYSERSYVSRDADTLPLGDSLSINSQPSGGTNSQFSGDAFVGGILIDLYARLIDLSGVNNDGVKKRHIDFGSGGAQVNAKDFQIVDPITMGGSAGSILGTSQITAALQAIATALKNLSGADAAAVKRAHIDLGVGGTQLHGNVIPIGEAISQALTNLPTLSIADSDTVKAAIAKVGVSLAALATRLDTDEDSIDAIATLLASTISQIEDDVMQAKMLPVGTIMMFDGEGWTDNVTLVGWYACVAANAGRGCPDLVNRFIKGGPKGTRGQDYGVTGGSNTKTITAANLPLHTHAMSHKHAVTTVAGGEHTHNGSYYPYRSGDQYIDVSGGGGIATLGQIETSKATSAAGSHTHSGEATIPPRDNAGNVMNDTGNGGFANSALNIEPAYYTVIFIRRCV